MARVNPMSLTYSSSKDYPDAMFSIENKSTHEKGRALWQIGELGRNKDRMFPLREAAYSPATATRTVLGARSARIPARSVRYSGLAHGLGGRMHVQALRQSLEIRTQSEDCCYGVEK
jgi:hypothetical protein